MPAQKPRKVGRKASCPMALDCSTAGTMRRQMEAATITPAAKPVSARCTLRFKSFFQKEHAGGPGRRADKGDQKPRDDRVHFLPNNPFFS